MFTLMPTTETPARRRRKRKLPPNTFRVYFQDEAPRLGAGWRLVELLTIGRKWATFREVATGTRARLRKAEWLTVTKHASKIS
jgi:hypothetical protein